MKNEREIYVESEIMMEKEEIRLRKANLSTINYELIKRWQKYLYSTGSGNKRVVKLTIQIRKICCYIKKDINILEKGDLEDILSHLKNKNNITDATRTDYIRCLKQFYKWFKGEDKRLHNPILKTDVFNLVKILKGNNDEIQEVTSEIREANIEKDKAQKMYDFIENEVKRTYKIKEIDPSEIINEEELSNIIEKGCKTHKEKAFLMMLHETGARIGEFLNIRLRDITIKQEILEINVDGKTGKRTIFCNKSIPYLLRYLDIHHDKDNPNSFLWLSDNRRSIGTKIHYLGAIKLVDRCFKRAGSNKRHNVHWFRHSRATILCQKITETQLRKYMGWAKDSMMIKTYTHLSNKDIKDVMSNVYGIKNEDEDKVKPIKCICGTLNNSSERYCYKCSRALKIETIINDRELVNTELAVTIRKMMEVFKDPEQLKAFEEFKKRGVTK